jgi:hypothetical protein
VLLISIDKNNLISRLIWIVNLSITKRVNRKRKIHLQKEKKEKKTGLVMSDLLIAYTFW